MDKTKKLLIVVVLASAFLVAYFVFASPAEDKTNNPAGAENDTDPTDTTGTGTGTGQTSLTDQLGVLLSGTGVNSGLATNQLVLLATYESSIVGGTVKGYGYLTDTSNILKWITPDGSEILGTSTNGKALKAELVSIQKSRPGANKS